MTTLNLKLIDTHTHLNLKEFDHDRDSVIKNACKFGIERLYLPSLNSKTVVSLLDLERSYPKVCFPMIGLHPCQVINFNILETELNLIKDYLAKHRFFAIGEIGIDLFWGKKSLKEQEEAFRQQIHLSKEYDLPIVIHCRSAFEAVFNILEQEKSSSLRGIFHCFTGTFEQAKQAISYGMKLGIGGLITLKNSPINHFVSRIPLNSIVLETDSPYLTPLPNRGRNEPRFLLNILTKISDLYALDEHELALITSQNACEIFSNKSTDQ